MSNTLFDTHAHILTADTTRYPPSPLSGRLRPGVLDDPMTAERLIDAMDAHEVRQAALVQRAHVYGYDNSYVVDAAARYPERFSAICVIDSVSPDARTRALEWIDRGARGLRLTEPARGADGAWLNGSFAREVWEVVAERGVTLSLQLYTWNRNERLPEIRAIAAEYGAVPVIVEHLSNVAESAVGPDFGVDADLDALARLSNVFLKVTTINLARCLSNGVDATAVLGRLGAASTFDRLIWGSDVAQSPQSYAEMTSMALQVVDRLGEADRAAVLSKTASELFAR